MDLAQLAARHGVATSYEPAPGRRVEVPQETVLAVLAAMGIDASAPAPLAERLLPPTLVQSPELPGRLSLDLTGSRIETESGESLPWSTALPLGCHILHAAMPDGRTARATLIVAPDRIPLPMARGHGLLVQLYSLLSARSWGMGDLGDLGELSAWAARTHGCDFVQLNPLHATVPGEPADPSPYRPSSRRFPDPVHLSIEDIPEYRYLPPQDREQATGLLARAAALREAVTVKGELIDRDAVWRLKRAALEIIRTVPLTPGRRAAYRDFLAAQGRALDEHATWCALADLHGPDWRGWPAELRHPRSPGVARARSDHVDQVDFHSWLAWLTDSQLARAQRIACDSGMSIGVIHDLALGVHPSGADAWAQQDAFAAGMSIGAPPDAFNGRGQDWGLPPWRPDALAAEGYGPYREVLRGLLRHAGALRIDHVMGLFRLWWVPEGRPPAEGTYVSYDAEAMLGVLALEAHRTGTPVIGEDLGTVEPHVRETLAARGVLGTSVLWFERDYAAPHAPPLPPERWRPGCLATATTHDLPSTAARLTGEHAALRHRLGLLDTPLAEARHQESSEVAEWLGLLAREGLLPGGQHEEEEVIKAFHRLLARTPAALIGVWLPDTVGDRRPANLPGTTAEYPNWRLPLADPEGRPVTFEDLAASPRAHALLTEVRNALGATAPVHPVPETGG